MRAMLAALLLTLGLTVSAAPADAAVKPCVTGETFWHNHPLGITKPQLDKLWGVVGTPDPLVQHVWDYRRCGYTYHERYFGVIWDWNYPKTPASYYIFVWTPSTGAVVA